MTAVTARVRFGARPSSTVPRYTRGETVEVWCDFRDVAGALVDVSGVSVTVWWPGGAQADLVVTPVEEQGGIWRADVPVLAYSGLWRIEFACTAPSAAVDTSWFSVSAPEPDEGPPPPPTWPEFSVLVGQAAEAAEAAGGQATLAESHAAAAETAAANAAAVAESVRAEPAVADPAFGVADDYGNVILTIDEAGLLGVPAIAARDTLSGPGFDLVTGNDVVAFAVGDPNFMAAFVVTTGGVVQFRTGEVLSLALGDATVAGALAGPSYSIIDGAGTGFAFAVADDNGLVAFAVTEDGRILGNGLDADAEPDGFSDRDIAEANARALALSATWSRQVDTTSQRLTADYNHIVAYGQSLSIGAQGWPARSVDTIPGALMVGDSVHGLGHGSSSWTQFGSAAWSPMRGTVLAQPQLSVLTDEDVAGLPSDAPNVGETVLEGAIHFLRRAQLDARGEAETSTAHALVATACGTGGRTIADLSKGASPELYNRVVDAAEIVQGLAAGESASYAVSAILWLQGEDDYSAGTTKEAYKAAMRQLIADLRADVQVGIAGQSRPPAVISYQTGAAYTNDALGLAIGQAQLELTQEDPSFYLAAPAYPVPDKGGHLTSNGYRWLGQQMGKVLGRVLVRGEQWRPLSPLEVQRRGREVLALFHVPCPPLVFDAPYVISTATDYAAKGFALADAAGAVTISTVEIVGEAVVRIVAARDLTGPVILRYATKATYNGNGCLRDSDPTVAADRYEYVEGSGDDPAHDIATLVDRPYPLWNWCVAFSVEAMEV